MKIRHWLHSVLTPRPVLDDRHDTTTNQYVSNDVRDTGFPLVPDDHHLLHVGKTTQGNGYWITPQLVTEADGTRDFIAAYLFDTRGNNIFCKVVDLGIRNSPESNSPASAIRDLRRNIDAEETCEIWVKPFATSFYGHTFGLIVRDTEEDDCDPDEVVVDAMPGMTLMFHSPWTTCNYAS